MKVAITLIALALTGGTFVLTHRPSDPQKNGKNPATHALTNCLDFEGMTILTDAGPLKIQQQVFGVTPENEPGAAIFAGTDSSGETIHFEHPELYSRVAFDTTELEGVAMRRFGDATRAHRVILKSLEYGADKEGRLVVERFTGKGKTAR